MKTLEECFIEAGSKFPFKARRSDVYSFTFVGQKPNGYLISWDNFEGTDSWPLTSSGWTLIREKRKVKYYCYETQSGVLEWSSFAGKRQMDIGATHTSSWPMKRIPQLDKEIEIDETPSSLAQEYIEKG